MDVGDGTARKRYLYHFTHSDNVLAILNSGYVTCDAVARNGQMRTEVGDPDIKESRRRRVIPIGPGGCVGDYVPFYFAPRSPMMFRIACDHRDSVPGRYAGGDRPLVYLVTTVGAVADAGLTWVATDGNAATATTEFTSDLRTMDEGVDWPLMKAARWKNTPDDPDRQRRRMAEFLVHRRLPTSLIRWYGVFDEAHASRIRAQLADRLPADRVIVRPTGTTDSSGGEKHDRRGTRQPLGGRRRGAGQHRQHRRRDGQGHRPAVQAGVPGKFPGLS